MKKSLCALLCVLVLFSSVALVGSAENATHPSGCDCSDCAGSRPASDYSYVEPSASTTFPKPSFDSVVSDVFGDDLVEIGKDSEEKIDFIANLLDSIRAFFQGIADWLANLTLPLKQLFSK